MTTELDELQLKLDKELCDSFVEKLVKLAVFIGLGEEKYTGKSKLALTRLLRRDIEEKIVQFEDEDSCRTFIENTRAELREKDDNESVKSQDETTNDEIEKLKEQLSSLEENHLKQVEALQLKIKETASKQTGTKTNTGTVSDLKQIFRRDFKLNGQIGEPNQKDKLTFISLVRQIESALARGDQEAEIIDAVIRAIVPGMQLRSYLETIHGLTLPRLRSILRSHFQEKSATKLYQQLTTIVKTPYESPQSFLIRALDLRQKVLFASKEAGVKLVYDERLVQGLFLHSLETGLQQEAVRTKLRPFLQDTDISDEKLIEQMNLIVSTETERLKKFGSAGQSKQKRVNNVNVEMPNQDPDQALQQTSKEKESEEKKKPKEGKLFTKMEAVKVQLAEIKETLKGRQRQDLDREQPYRNQDSSRRRVCTRCQETRSTQCDHCFRCGSADHFARGCRKRVNAGNGRWLPPRDRE